MDYRIYKNWTDWRTDPRKRFRLNGKHADISWYYYNQYHPEDPIRRGDGNDIHHIDFNHFNNDISNLIMMSHVEHMILHGQYISEETKMKMSKNHADFSGNKNPNYGKDFSGDKNPNAKYCMAEYMIFSTVTNAAKVFNIPRTTITYRIKTNKAGYMYI